MKKFLFIVLATIVFALALSAQSKDSLYAITYTVRPLWDVNKSPND